MKRLLTMLVLVSFIFLWGSQALGRDTGTYKIQEYKVKLTPHSDGKVEIEYYQKWLVTGGHIPWMSVGLPNSHFEIQQKNRGAVKSIKADNSDDWSGVRIDLDKDYQPNQEFEVWFSVIQTRLFYADDKNYKLDFTPGWYDRAETGKLTIEVFFFAKLETVTAEPKPTRTENQSMVWEKSGLGKGEKFQVVVSFAKTLFPKEIDKGELRREGLSTGWIVLIVIVVIILLIILIAWLSSEYGDGGYGGGGGVWGGGGGGGGRGSGGGGGFGGASFSCACVSCACACACAGGGGAGCGRKLTHSCPLCRKGG